MLSTLGWTAFACEDEDEARTQVQSNLLSRFDGMGVSQLHGLRTMQNA
jgi:hypothetical protein